MATSSKRGRRFLLNYSESFLCRLRDVLIAHMDGVRVPIAPNHSQRKRDTAILISNGYLATVGTPCFDCTEITERGRQCLSDVLADYADALERAGFGDPVWDRSTFNDGSGHEQRTSTH